MRVKKTYYGKRGQGKLFPYARKKKAVITKHRIVDDRLTFGAYHSNMTLRR